MEILLDKYSKIPVYEQIYQAIRNQIISENLKANQQLPSIRLLAKNLGVSVITSKRAYEDLERDGFIYTVAGKGTYITDQKMSLLLESYISDIEEHFKEIIVLARSARLEEDRLVEIYRKVRDRL